MRVRALANVGGRRRALAGSDTLGRRLATRDSRLESATRVDLE